MQHTTSGMISVFFFFLNSRVDIHQKLGMSGICPAILRYNDMLRHNGMLCCYSSCKSQLSPLNIAGFQVTILEDRLLSWKQNKELVASHLEGVETVLYCKFLTKKTDNLYTAAAAASALTC